MKSSLESWSEVVIIMDSVLAGNHGRKTSEIRKPGHDSTSREQVVIEKWVMWEVVLMLEKI